MVITFENGTLDDYRVLVDGTDITDALLPVDDAKTIVKWETTELKPGSVTVTRISDSRNQTVNFTNPSPATGPLAGTAGTAPAAILTNGPVSRFDYYLDVYDKDGQVREVPGQTTFDLSGRRNLAAEEIPSEYYAPDTLINQENGNGEIVLKLALKTTAQRAWFDKITTLKVLDQENQILNGNLAFRTSIEEAYGTTGVLKISLPQTNLYSRGRYQINIKSDYSRAAMTLPVHLVDNRTFTMKLNTLNLTPKPGEDFAFTIAGDDGATFGNEILSPIYRVDLTMPSGKTKTLEKLSEYYEIGDYLRICGTNTENDVVTEESGLYTVTVYADGYQTMKKSVEIGAAMKSFSIFSSSSKSSSGVDALSSATISSSTDISDDSGSSAGGSMNAFLIFDHDLITNALILKDLEMANAASNAVLDRWNLQTPVAVMDENAEELYDFVIYFNEVKDARLNKGEYLSFSHYTKLGKGQTQNRPYQIKRVLEDGLLGSSIPFSSLEGKNPPTFKGTSAALGEDLTLSTEPTLYFNPAIELYLDASAVPLRNDDYLKEYLFNSETDTLTIYSTRKGTAGGDLLLTPGVHELRIFSEGYQPARVIITIIQTPEVFELALVNPNPNAAGSAEDTSVYYTGQDVHIKAAADSSGEDNSLRGDFMKHLQGIELMKPDGISSPVTSNTEGALYGDDNYVPADFSFTLQRGLFKTEGTYRVTARAKGYTPKTLEFHIEKAAVAEVIPTELEAPQVADVAYVAGSYGDDPFYRISFNDTEGTLDAYLKKIRGQKAIIQVRVNETIYSFSGLSFRDDKAAYKITNDLAYGNPLYLDLTTDGFKAGENTISIEVEGYQALHYNDLTPPDAGTAGEIVPPPASSTPVPEEELVPELPSDELEAPAIGKVEYSSDFGDKYYRVSFKNATENELSTYLNAIDNSDKTTINVNTAKYGRTGSSLWGNKLKYKISKDAYGTLKYLDLTADGFTTGENTITITVNEYTVQIFAVRIDATGKVTPPEAESSAPKTAPLISEIKVTIPRPETATSKTAAAAPETEAAAPETAAIAPETAVTAPETEAGAPETGITAPETEITAPETRLTDSSHDAAQPPIPAETAEAKSSDSKDEAGSPDEKSEYPETSIKPEALDRTSL